MKKSLVLIIMSLIINVGTAKDRYPFVYHQQQQQFDTLTQELRCLVCQNEDLASSSAPLAADLRQDIYQMILQGKSDEQITRYMANRYGHFILFKPPFIRVTWFLWLAPFVLLLMGVVVVWKVVTKYQENRLSDL